MSEWTDGYRAALADVGRLGCSQGILTLGGRREAELLQLLADLEGDAIVVERKADNRITDQDFCTGFDVPIDPWTAEDIAYWTGSLRYQPWKDIARLFIDRPTQVGAGAPP